MTDKRREGAEAKPGSEALYGYLMTIFTIGHSTHTIETFIELLNGAAISLVADVRTVPRSRHNPQFNKDELPAQLELAGIGYIHFPGREKGTCNSLVPSCYTESQLELRYSAACA